MEGRPEHAVEGISVQEAARYLGVHPQTIRNWIREGKLACERHGPTGWLISIKKDDLEPFKKHNEGGTPSG